MVLDMCASALVLVKAYNVSYQYLMVINMKRIGQEILNDWKEKVASKLGRSVEEISARGLSATDFNGSSKVILSHPGELECVFNHAFSIVDAEAGKVAVFTEHCGYHEFYLNGMKVSDIVVNEYWDEDYCA